MIGIELNNELKKGNPEAYKKFFQAVYPRLKGYCKLFIADNGQVEDIIQESFITLWEKRNKIKLDKSVESLIFIIVRNRCLNFLKKAKVEEEITENEKNKDLGLQYLYQLDLLETQENSLEEMLVKSFQEEIENLPGKMKKVFVMCKIEGRKQKEVANELGISIKMVEKHIANAKIKLRENLIKQYPALLLLISILFD